jgi:hypothetical protein
MANISPHAAAKWTNIGMLTNIMAILVNMPPQNEAMG